MVGCWLSISLSDSVVIIGFPLGFSSFENLGPVFGSWLNVSAFVIVLP
jgi:hypothetical protein